MAEPPFTAAQRRAVVVRRAGGCCEYCLSQSRFSPDPFSVEHIVPVSGGGADDPDNLALACQGCNSRKYTHTDALDPVTGDRAPPYHPRRQRWADHFAWADGFSTPLGLTPTGRATVERLALNRAGVRDLRRLLVSVAEHPPPIESNH